MNNGICKIASNKTAILRIGRQKCNSSEGRRYALEQDD
jgi:hypothetical protein